MDRVAHLSPIACFSLIMVGFIFGVCTSQEAAWWRLLLAASLITMNLIVVWLDGRQARPADHMRTASGFWWSPINNKDKDEEL